MLAAVPAAAGCRLALAIGLDVSRSVDRREDGLQIEGLADALLAPAVQRAFMAGPEPVALAVYEWSGAGDQRLILPWTTITDASALDLAARTILADPRTTRRNRTAIGSSMGWGFELLTQSSGCAAHTLDLTGDGFSNEGPLPARVTAPAGLPALTVNALVIAPLSGVGEDPRLDQLQRYFEDQVIRGTGAFVERAVGFEDFREAMERKLLRELGFGAFSRALPPGGLRLARLARDGMR
jgi:hypothetical protein